MPYLDWSCLQDVIAYARNLGPGMTVFRRAGAANFNITHTARPDRYAGCVVFFQT